MTMMMMYGRLFAITVAVLFVYSTNGYQRLTRYPQDTAFDLVGPVIRHLYNDPRNYVGVYSAKGIVVTVYYKTKTCEFAFDVSFRFRSTWAAEAFNHTTSHRAPKDFDYDLRIGAYGRTTAAKGYKAVLKRLRVKTAEVADHQMKLCKNIIYVF